MSESGRTCPSCRRPVALARPQCLYCGAPLPPDMVDAPQREHAAGAEAAPERRLLVLDLASADKDQLAQVLGIGVFEADQRQRRGGLELVRIGEAGAVEAEAERLLARGLRVRTVPEEEVRGRPLRALGGLRDGEVIRLKTEEKPLVVDGRDLLLVVRGPIVREHQKAQRASGLLSKPLLRALEIDVTERRHADAYRIHLHRRSDPRPVELDPGAFEFGRVVVESSSLLELLVWLEEIAPGVASDDGFRRLPPLLAVAEPEPGSLAGALDRRSGRAQKEDVVLDNLGQFRFYSAWRAAYERRRPGP